jgi:hypothetical protein
MALTYSKSLLPSTASVGLIFASLCVALALPASVSATSTPALTDKDIKKAEKIITKLRRLEEVTASPLDFRTYEAEIKRIYPAIFADASEVRESDLKTHLTTAVFLYDAAYRNWFELINLTTDCDRELREIYRKLCREDRGGDPACLLWSKARLHTKYGEAVVRSYRGATDPVTLSVLAEMEEERQADLILAAHAVAALRELGVRVKVYLPHAESETGRRATRVSFGQFSGEVSSALRVVDQVLASMPRSPLRLLLHNARSGYRDGLFWWEKVYLRQEMTVSALSLAAPDPLNAVGLEADVVRMTALNNWSSALKYTDRAEKAVNEAMAAPNNPARIEGSDRRASGGT